MRTGLPLNPYDFSNPVANPLCFAGRESQMREAEYYLAQAVATVRPTHLAILGPRAAGKTSMLNMLATKAEEVGLEVVRINLDQSDARSPLGFFFKVIDGLATKAFEKGAWGGI